MRTAAFGLLRLAVSISILAVLLWRAPISEIAARAANAAVGYLALSLALVLASAVIVAMRWRLMAASLGLAISPALAIRALFLGMFGAQVLPAVVGTDVLRGWAVVRHTGRMGAIAASLLADRLTGLFAVCLLFALATPVVAPVAAPVGAWLAPVALLGTGAAAGAFIFRARARPNGWLVLAALGLALAIHAIAVAVAALVARAYGVQDSLPLWLSIIPLSIIASSVPVSINGWGVREATIVALAAPLGIPAAEALLVSLTLGGLNMMASLPGAAVLLRGR